MKTERALRAKIDRIKQALSTLGDLRPGSLSQQYNVCGTPGCRCKADLSHRHGPYYQISYTRKGKSHTESVHKEHLAAVRNQLQNYQKLQKLINTWLDLSIELDRLRRSPIR